MVSVDITKTPFSRYGAYLAVTAEPGQNTLTIHNCRRRFGEDVLHVLTFLHAGQPADIRLSATPWVLDVAAAQGTARIYLAGDTSLVIASAGLDFRLELRTKLGYGVHEGPRRFKVIDVWAHLHIGADLYEGEGTLGGPRDEPMAGVSRPRNSDLTVTCADGHALLRLEVSVPEPSPARPVERPDVDADLAVIRAEWERFAAQLPAVAEHRKEIALLTWYNLWSCVVRAEDVYRYDAMLMSKKFMCSVWSWDHCFNALAMAGTDPRMALEQFLLPFELQSVTGVLPDLWNPNAELAWGVTKPPVHGWCFGRLMDCIPFDPPTLRRVYRYLEKLTRWWLVYRDANRNGIPEYPMGCDSGWDNSTLFDEAFFVETPDLPAFLVLQMDTLARIAEALGRPAAALKWRRKATALWSRFMRSSWNGRNFVVRMADSPAVIEEPTSLLALMPLVLGDRLEPAVFAALVARLEADFLTEHGPATEALRSPKYKSDGYWRGPIWAPTTYLICDGLLRGGRRDLAVRIARGFCDMIQHRAGGNYENFDAVTGRGLCAPGYTWTASVNLLLLEQLHREGVE